jgi:hypothetical protein
VQTQKPHKIDLNGDYPCPCRRRGKLTPIALTDAFGCDRCQQIFVVQDSGHTIEQLSTNYPYKRAWRWNGHQWIVVNPSLGKGYVPLTLLFMFALVFLLLLTTLSAPAGSQVAFRVVAALVLSVMLAFMLWLACRR